MLVFFICLIILILIILSLSTISIAIDKFSFSNYEENTEKKDIQLDYNIKIQLLLFQKIKYFQFTINKEKLKKYNLTEKLKNINYYKLSKDMPKLNKDIKIIEKLKLLELKKLNMKINIGTEDVILTSLLILFLSTGVPMILTNIIKEYDKKDYYYRILPLYKNKNILKITINCIIYIKLVHIIHVLYILMRKRSVGKNERASYRRFNDDSYGQHTRYGRCKYNYR